MSLFIVAALVLVGCGGGGDSASGTTTTAPADTTTTSTGALEATAQSALLTAAEIGPGFVAGQYVDNSGPLPCAAAGAVDPDITIPPAVKVGATAQDSANSLFFQETIRLYADDAEGTTAMTNAVSGFSCAVGTTDNGDGTTTSINISAPQDVASQVGVDEAMAWQISTDQIQGVLIIARLSAAIVTFDFETVLGGDTTNAPDTLQLATAGIEKVKSTG